jgi:hypothetical protein
VGFGFRPEVDLGVMVVGATGEEIAVVDWLKIESGEEAGGGELFSVGENVLVEAMIPIGFGEEGFEIKSHGRRLVDRAIGAKEKRLLTF